MLPQNFDQSNQSDPIPQKGDSANYLWPAIVALVLVAVVGSAFVVLYPKKADAPILQPQTSNETLIDTTDWKTYRNEEYRFEARYPGDWWLKISSKGDRIDNLQTFYFRSPDYQTISGSELSIWPIGSIPLQLYFENLQLEEKIIAGSTVKVRESNDSSFLAYSFTDSVPEPWIKCGVELEDCGTIVISFDKESDLRIINRILSTFKFIN